MPLILNGTTGVSGVDGTAATPAAQGSDTNTGIYFPAADTIAFAEGGVESMRLDSSGNVGIGTTSPARPLHVYSASTSYIARFQNAGTALALINFKDSTTGDFTVGLGANGENLVFQTSTTERMRLDSSGNLLVGTTSASESGRLRVLNTNSTEWNNLTASFEAANGTRALAIYNGAAGFNAAATCVQMGRNTATSRSLNASGTLNASGADYAEYMEKAGEFTVAKGDICGVDSNGKITNVFADAVTFVVKSTNPSYVGGDTWGVGFDRDDPELEVARQKVDRIAFAGQVPVNVTGASAGDYIIPESDNGSIKGVAVSNPTFEQYRIAVGRVITTEADGRARIIVKVA